MKKGICILLCLVMLAILAFPVMASDAPGLPEITTKSLNNGTVGVNYYQRLECTDPDVVFSMFRSTLPDGMYLTQHGELEGTPTQAGTYYLVIAVKDQFGVENTAEFTLIIEEAQQYSLEIVQLPNKLVYTSGEKLDMTGLQVRVYTPDGFFDSRDGEKLTYTKKALVTVGEQKIKISYEDASEVFIITVEAAPTQAPTETTTEAPTETPTETTTQASEETAAPT